MNDSQLAALTEPLVAAGMSAAAAAEKRGLLARCAERLGGGFEQAWFIPGRIEFLGKHTDYAGGRSLLCAVEQGFCMLAKPRADRQMRVISAASGEEVSVALEPSLSPTAGHWSNYPMTVAARVTNNFPGASRGVDIAFASDLPPAAGLSSSSALVVGTFFILSALNQLPDRQEYQAAISSREDLCGYLGTIENGQSFGTLVGSQGVGTFGGSEDHTAIVCSTAGALAQYSFKPVRREAEIPFPRDYTFVIGASGVIAEKTRAARDRYNRVSRTVGVILEEWHRVGGKANSLAEVVRASRSDREKLHAALARSTTSEFSPQELLARVAQFEQESDQWIPQAAEALRAGRFDQLGDIVDASQAAAEQALLNQVPETKFLAGSARQLGAVAASAFGAGFGGSVWAMVPKNHADAFSAQWAQAYQRQFPAAALRARFFFTGCGPAAVRLQP